MYCKKPIFLFPKYTSIQYVTYISICVILILLIISLTLHVLEMFLSYKEYREIYSVTLLPNICKIAFLQALRVKYFK